MSLALFDEHYKQQISQSFVGKLGTKTFSMTNITEGTAVKGFLRLVSQYGSTSLFATVLDFGVFEIALKYFAASAVIATLFGRAVGSITSFLIHRHWVFNHVTGLDIKVLLTKYIIGIIIGTILNLGGVWLLNEVVGFGPWPSRIITSTTVWFIVFTYNRLWVFSKGRNITTQLANSSVVHEEEDN